MKINKYIKVLILLAVMAPFGVKANIETIPNEARILDTERPAMERVRDLQNRLWKQEVEEKRSELQQAREAFKNASPENKKIMRNEFRAKFEERFKFTIERLTFLQNKLAERLTREKASGVDTTTAEQKLEESKSYNEKISKDVEALKTLLAKDYTEIERAAKIEEAKKIVESIKANIKSAHQKLKEAFMELKNSKVETNTEESNEQ